MKRIKPTRYKIPLIRSYTSWNVACCRDGDCEGREGEEMAELVADMFDVGLRYLWGRGTVVRIWAEARDGIWEYV